MRIRHLKTHTTGNAKWCSLGWREMMSETENLNEGLKSAPTGKVKESHLVVSDSLWPLWTRAYQAPLSLEFSRQEYWSGLTLPSPGDLPDPGIEPESPALQADSLPSEPPRFRLSIFSKNTPWLMLCISQLYHVIVEANHLCGYPLTLNNLFPSIKKH